MVDESIRESHYMDSIPMMLEKTVDIKMNVSDGVYRFVVFGVYGESGVVSELYNNIRIKLHEYE